MTYIVDRIEAGIAVLESINDKEVIEVSKRSLPKGIREGHILQENGGAYAIDYEMTKQRQAQIKARMKRIFDKHRT